MDGPGFVPQITADKLRGIRDIAEARPRATEGLEPDEVVRAHTEYQNYVTNHETYLTELMDRVEEKVDADPALVVSPLFGRSSGRSSPVTWHGPVRVPDRIDISKEVVSPTELFVAHNNGQPLMSLDVSRLRLPLLPGDDADPVLGLLVERDERRWVTSVRAITTPLGPASGEPQREPIRAEWELQNYAAVTDPNTPVEPQWRRYGTPLSKGLVSVSKSRELVRNPVTRFGFLQLVVSDLPGFDSYGPRRTVELIRQVPTRVEQLAPTNPEQHRRTGRFAKGVGAVALVGAIVAGATGVVPSLKSPGRASILAAGTAFDRGIPQAEAGFTEDVLGRVDTALEAYYNNDAPALRQQAEALGFRDGWVNAIALEKVRQADNPEQLNAAFREAMGEVPVTLEIVQDQPTADKLSEFYYHDPVKDFDKDKSLTLDMVGVLNTMSLQMVKDLGPYTFAVISDMGLKNKDGTRGEPADGYHATLPDGRNVIVIREAASSRGEIVAAHEATHAEDLEEIGGLSAMVDELNPSGIEYGRNGDYKDAHTSIDGNRFAVTGYATESETEDVAELGSDIINPHPERLYLKDGNSLSEKYVALMAALDKRYPGFSASALKRVLEANGGTSSRGVLAGRLFGGVAGIVLSIAVAGATITTGLRRDWWVRIMAKHGISGGPPHPGD
jgi:hypothetical protein